jgi:hypothetical protein
VIWKTADQHRASVLEEGKVVETLGGRTNRYTLLSPFFHLPAITFYYAVDFSTRSALFSVGSPLMLSGDPNELVVLGILRIGYVVPPRERKRTTENKPAGVVQVIVVPLTKLSLLEYKQHLRAISANRLSERLVTPRANDRIHQEQQATAGKIWEDLSQKHRDNTKFWNDTIRVAEQTTESDEVNLLADPSMSSGECSILGFDPQQHQPTPIRAVAPQAPHKLQLHQGRKYTQWSSSRRISVRPKCKNERVRHVAPCATDLTLKQSVCFT